jgi:hypothetical protein
MINGCMWMPDNTCEIILNNDEFVKVVEQRMGYEAAEHMQSLVEDAEDIDKINSDLLEIDRYIIKIKKYINNAETIEKDKILENINEIDRILGNSYV